jgi:outer membrane lipoprotein-sorting protein
MDFLNPCLLSLGLFCTAGLDAPAETPATSVAPAPAPRARGSASTLLARVQAYYNATQDMEVSFAQTYVNQVFGTRRQSEGTLLVKQPGLMVWDYTNASDPDLYVDGATLSVVEHETRQVLTRDVEQDANLAGAMNFLFGGESLLQDFRVRHASATLRARYGQAGREVIELKPRARTHDYKTMLLVVDETSGRVDGFVVRNHDGSINHITFAGARRNGGLADARFTFLAPRGYVTFEG